ncbi:iron ABC transporter permease [Clostridium sp. CF011]|uniref:FecCD family ABC transporter permease n=1 Tax=Clostridium sp. CF011 TaxID=2843318 RepID=UPI001C0CF1CD|nr:iron ABC transporter permease [Clostridium sp. CF011]MBU3092326.1 iron ABC transporter permease [Clostridium sp. CF011]WAG71606.1 iron ABC transporter permease [Clostridium sp. CF011]
MDYTKNEIQKRTGQNLIVFILIVSLIATFIVSFTIGRFPISLNQLIKTFYLRITGNEALLKDTTQSVLFDVRLPRIIAAILVGSALSVSGATFQGLFKNPMVSADILGASAGAGFGAAVAILLSLGTVWIQLLSFVFGFAAVALTYAISKAVGRGSSQMLVLILTGMVVQALFTSSISLTKYVADPDSKLPAITFWLMGGLSSITMNDIKIVLIPMLLGVIPLMLIRWKLNVLSFGDEEAKSLGIDTTKMRAITIVCSTLLTASTVSICGMIGWLGLVIPHLARMIVGPNYKVLLPASFLIGGIFMLAVDDLARCLFAVEIPLGILTAMIGAPFFIYLLLNGKKGWL